MEISFSLDAIRQMDAHNIMLGIHSRVLACHCECLGMNAENSFAVCKNRVIPYNNISYEEVMQKWGIVNNKGEPII